MGRWLWLPLCALPALAASPLSLTIVCDNTSGRPDLKADWGFSVLAEFQGRRILFDKGNRADVFQANLKALGIPEASIEQTVISHRHSEPGAWARMMPSGFLRFLDAFTPTSPSEGPAQLAPGFYSTGEIAGSPPERALLIETSKGLVMLVGCAHPGIAKMAEAAEKQRNRRSIRLLIGGLHLYERDEREIRYAVSQLQKLHVESVAPAHCSGDLTRKLLREAYGARFEEAGAGKRIVLD